MRAAVAGGGFVDAAETQRVTESALTLLAEHTAEVEQLTEERDNFQACAEINAQTIEEMNEAHNRVLEQQRQELEKYLDSLTDDPDATEEYKAGWRDCREDVSRFFALTPPQEEGAPGDDGIDFLASKLAEMEHLHRLAPSHEEFIEHGLDAFLRLFYEARYPDRRPAPPQDTEHSVEGRKEMLTSEVAIEAFLRSREARHVDPPERGSEDWQCWQADAEEDLDAVAAALTQPVEGEGQQCGRDINDSAPALEQGASEEGGIKAGERQRCERCGGSGADLYALYVRAMEPATTEAQDAWEDLNAVHARCWDDFAAALKRTPEPDSPSLSGGCERGEAGADRWPSEVRLHLPPGTKRVRVAPRSPAPGFGANWENETRVYVPAPNGPVTGGGQSESRPPRIKRCSRCHQELYEADRGYGSTALACPIHGFDRQILELTAEEDTALPQQSSSTGNSPSTEPDCERCNDERWLCDECGKPPSRCEHEGLLSQSGCPACTSALWGAFDRFVELFFMRWEDAPPEEVEQGWVRDLGAAWLAAFTRKPKMQGGTDV